MMIRWKVAQWFELWWWKRYMNQKNKMQYISWKSSYWLGLIERLGMKQHWLFASDVADLGCGPFGLSLIHEPLKKPLVAVDPLINEYEQQLNHFKKEEYPSTQFINSTLESYNSEKKFDFVFCMNAINHVSDIVYSIKKLAMLTKENGILIIGADAHNYAFFNFLFRLVPGDILHPHQYNLLEYELMLKNSGFEIKKQQMIKKEFFFSYWVIVAERRSK
jgi:2-polyprenyl-3-methyl-5-hydroxy-6-metoxy-1,4-benzoquinol methylase